MAGAWARAYAAHLAPATRSLYGYLYDRHISPSMGEYRLRDIDPEVIAVWQSGLLEAGVGKVAIKKAMTLLGAILQRAAESRRIGSNPQRLVRKLRLPKPQEVRPLAPETVEAMRAAASQRDATLISILPYAGLRPAEALTLEWPHVGERTIVVDAPKTGARRTIRLLGPLAEDLEGWRAAVAADGQGPVVPRCERRALVDRGVQVVAPTLRRSGGAGRGRSRSNAVGADVTRSARFYSPRDGA